jgi:hypothetical protein
MGATQGRPIGAATFAVTRGWRGPGGDRLISVLVDATAERGARARLAALFVPLFLTARCSRAAARSRAEATARASTLAPGNSTLPSISRTVARSNRTLGRSAVAHARAFSQPTSSVCAESSEKSR